MLMMTTIANTRARTGGVIEQLTNRVFFFNFKRVLFVVILRLSFVIVALRRLSVFVIRPRFFFGFSVCFDFGLLFRFFDILLFATTTTTRTEERESVCVGRAVDANTATTAHDIQERGVAVVGGCTCVVALAAP